MTFEKTQQVLNLLHTEVRKALSVAQIVEKLTEDATDVGGSPAKSFSSERQRIYRVVNKLVKNGLITSDPRKEDGLRQVHYYYKKADQTVQFLTNDHMALQVLLSAELLTHVLSEVPDLKNGNAKEIASLVLDKASAQVKRIYQALRVVPDGIGRPPVAINKEIVEPVIKAITDDRQVWVSYVDEKGKAKRQQVTPLLLIVKDGALYLIATDGFINAKNLISYALQRVKLTEISIKRAEPSDFNTRAAINKTVTEHFQYGHPVPAISFPLQAFPHLKVERRSARASIPEIEMLDLRLRVAPRALFHFTERKLSEKQVIKDAPKFPGAAEDANPDSWHVLSVKVPYTILLLPFILSYGQWVRVEGPAVVKEQLRIVTQGMAKLYSQ